MSERLTPPDAPPDWFDVHSGPVANPDWTARQAWEYAERHMPLWALAAMGVRNLVVWPLGLHAGRGQTKGIALSRLPVFEERADAFETGLIDRHLTFTLRTEVKDSQATITTRIWFNHWLGRVYLGVVWIGHKLILRHALRSLATAPEGTPA